MTNYRTPTATRAQRPRNTGRFVVGSGAGVLMWGLLLGVVVGAIWGALRPTYIGNMKDGMLLVDEAASPVNVEFSSFISFAILTGLAGAIIAIIAFLIVGGISGVGMLLWSGVVAFFAAVSFYVVGEWTANALHPMPEHSSGNLEGVKLVPALAPGVGWLAGPFMATLAYWTMALVATPEELEASSPADDAV
ncbi:hypothetical protein QP027_07290 [Corynebacterium breve]|uniref:DUF2567 domain-containing protein n=1 Tax=Corynebacterium breve TaxID=3049799 RepID=A0ABY8VCV4_9CORY|nr:hypothetical protein [Corynebacterium breve]WIM66937.1 hypothetical protein QP027_07290 [Corynebacterium breve]